MTVKLRQGDVLVHGSKAPIIIHINQHNIRKSIKGEDVPVVTIKHRSRTFVCNGVKWDGYSELRYAGAGNKPLLPCGARVVLAVYCDVTVTEGCVMGGDDD